MAARANDFLRHYEVLYDKLWNKGIDDPYTDRYIGAVNEAETIGKLYFGLTPDAYKLIRYKVEHNE